MMRAMRMLACAALLAAVGQAGAQYPSRPVRLVVPFAPGGATDILARAIGQKLGERLGQPVVIDNKPGAGTTIGADQVAKAAGDGHTLLFAPTPFAISQVMYPRLPYDAARDFAPVALLAVSPFILVAHPALPATSVAELVALARARSGQLTYGSAGNGTVPHLAAELFKLRAGVDIIHVPYKGGGPAIIDLVAGQTQLMFATPVEVAQHVAGGRLKVLAATAPTRLAAMPTVPTLRESGFADYVIRSWFGVLAPAATAPEVVSRVATELARVVEAAEIRERLAAQSAEVQVRAGAEFAAFIREDVARWAEVVKASGARVE
ncbi:MAG: tripartite tricarboxylate transporter substrate binding protein [Burkholderiales bacterium]|nr:tripartite tricarboxylate transporter substrate binding protein [Burkholderiales bacterium]